MTEKEMIAEMSVDVSNAWQLANQRNHFPNRRPLCDVLAEELYEMEYRKLQDGEIIQRIETEVLKGKKYDMQVMRMTRNTYDAVLAQTRKETAREILEWFEKRYPKLNVREYFAKQFGVEVE